MKFVIAFTLLVVTTSAELILPTEQIKDNEEFKYTLQDNQEKPAEAPTQIKIETTPNPDPLAPASASGAQARQHREIILGTHTSPLLVQSVLPRYVLFDQPQLPVYPFYILPYRTLEQQQQQQQQQQPQQKN